MISFTKHPESVGETYFQHLRHAMSFSIAMLVGGVACGMHALFPFLFETTGSRIIGDLHDRMVANRASQTPEAKRRPGLSSADDGTAYAAGSAGD